MNTSNIEESPGVVSMMRWALRAMVYTYIAVVGIITIVWVIKSFIGEPNWIFAGTLIGIVGGLKGLTELFKVKQKEHEVRGEIEEAITKSASSV